MQARARSVADALAQDEPGGPLWHEALDSINDISYDEGGMSERFAIVECGACGQIVGALDSGDVDVRCKAANALGGLCAAPAAAQAVMRHPFTH